MQIEFHKYQGTGNDFVILDNRSGIYNSISHDQVKDICHRHFGVGADGLMLLQEKDGYDFEMVYYNADGHLGSMCGNGGRCIVQFAYNLGIKKSNYHFIATDGPHDAEITDGIIKLKMKDVNEVSNRRHHFILNTGSPHYIKIVPDVNDINVYEEGKDIRYSNEFKEKGINVNFVEQLDGDSIFVRTYERGVENETMSCGTGVTAASLISAHNDYGFNHVDVKTHGGNLYVEFDKTSEHSFENIWLCGPAEFVFKGTGNW